MNKPAAGFCRVDARRYEGQGGKAGVNSGMLCNKNIIAPLAKGTKQA
ncbi:hypothetical protein [Sphingopyxis yananensis]|nr:hypothetical protein [Sphingopyxis yananensis]MCC2601214.1 hypothetical protein [Sphingopyxis yananensis]